MYLGFLETNLPFLPRRFRLMGLPIEGLACDALLQVALDELDQLGLRQLMLRDLLLGPGCVHRISHPLGVVPAADHAHLVHVRPQPLDPVQLSLLAPVRPPGLLHSSHQSSLRIDCCMPSPGTGSYSSGKSALASFWFSTNPVQIHPRSEQEEP